MALQTSGAICFQDLSNKFDVPKPVSLSQMYAGAAVVGNSLINWVSVGTISGSLLN